MQRYKISFFGLRAYAWQTFAAGVFLLFALLVSVPGRAQAFSLTAGIPIGWVDSADCNSIKGWALDTSAMNAQILVHIYIDAPAGKGGKLVGFGVADQPRTDLYEVFNTSVGHGFQITTPDEFKDGKSHALFVHGIDTSGNGSKNVVIGSGESTISVCTDSKVADTPSVVTNIATTNGATVLPGQDASLVGALETASCFQVNGWAYDKSNVNRVLHVNFYIDGPADGNGARGKLMIEYAVVNVQRDDVNQANNIAGLHGFVFRFASVLGNPIGDGKSHQIYAYAVDPDNPSRYALLTGSPTIVSGCTSAAGSGSGGGGGAGGSSRHNYMSSCKGNGDYNEKEDPDILAEVGSDGVVTFTITLLKGQPAPEIKDADGKVVTPTRKENPDGTVTLTFTYKATSDHPAGTTIKVGNHTYIVDTDGVPKEGTVSMLVPVPCIRIGYNDELGGQNCGDGQSGTCAKELDAFINVDGIQNTGLHIKVPPVKNAPYYGDDFFVQYKVVGNQTNTGGWKDYGWRACGQYINHCIRLKGQGIIYARTVLKDGKHFSLTTFKKFDADTGDSGLEDYDPL